MTTVTTANMDFTTVETGELERTGHVYSDAFKAAVDMVATAARGLVACQSQYDVRDILDAHTDFTAERDVFSNGVFYIFTPDVQRATEVEGTFRVGQIYVPEAGDHEEDEVYTYAATPTVW